MESVESVICAKYGLEQVPVRIGRPSKVTVAGVSPMREVIPVSMAPVIVLSRELVVVAELLVEELEVLALALPGQCKCIGQKKRTAYSW